MREECICNICNAAANLNISQSNEEQKDLGDRQISFALDELVPDRPKNTKPKGNMESGWMDGYARWSKLDDVLEQPPAATNDNKETEGKEKTNPHRRLIMTQMMPACLRMTFIIAMRLQIE